MRAAGTFYLKHGRGSDDVDDRCKVLRLSRYKYTNPGSKYTEA